MIRLQVEKIVGTPENKGWVQIHRFAGMEKKKYEQRGEMILLLCLEGVSEQTATSLGRELVSRVYEEYYGNLEGKLMDRLREMLDKVAKERPLYLTEKVKISLQVAVFWRDYVYLGIRGGGAAFLVRGGKILPLLSGEGGKATVISGSPEQDDLFFLGTREFFSQIPEGTIRACFQPGELKPVVEALAPLIHSRQDQGKIGVALIKVLPAEPGTSSLQLEKKPPPVLENKRRFSLPKITLPLRPPSFSRPSVNRILGIALMAVLLGSVGWGWRRQKKLNQEKQLNQLVSQGEEKLTAAESVRQLDANQSLTLARQALEALTKAEKLAPKVATINQAKQRAEKLITSLGGGEKIKPELFFNLSLLAEGAVGSQLVSLDKKLFVLDLKTARVFAFSYPEKTSRVFIGGEILKDKKLFAAAGEGKFYLLDDKGVIFWDGKDRQQRVVEAQWQQPVSLDVWGQNLYVLDKKAGQLWKFVSLGKEFSSPRDWFSSLPSFDWDKVQAMAINGHIWILTDDGKLHRFFAGQEDTVKFDSASIDSGRLLAVAAKSSRVAVLDKENKLFVWDKEGKIQLQLNLEIEAQGIALDPQGRWLFFLTKGEVRWLDLEKFIE